MGIGAFVVPPGGGTPIAGPVGGPTIIRARTENKGGSFALLENVVAPRQGPPLHLHAREDDMWCVFEGHFRFKANEEIRDAPTGSFVFAPRGTRHCFQDLGDQSARILVRFTPAGMERFFEDHAELPPGPVDPDVCRAIARSNWMELAGPPLAESHPF